MKVTDLIYTIKVDPPAHLFTGRSTLDKQSGYMVQEKHPYVTDEGR